MDFYIRLCKKFLLRDFKSVAFCSLEKDRYPCKMSKCKSILISKRWTFFFLFVEKDACKIVFVEFNIWSMDGSTRMGGKSRSVFIIGQAITKERGSNKAQTNMILNGIRSNEFRSRYYIVIYIGTQWPLWFSPIKGPVQLSSDTMATRRAWFDTNGARLDPIRCGVDWILFNANKIRLNLILLNEIQCCTTFHTESSLINRIVAGNIFF